MRGKPEGSESRKLTTPTEHEEQVRVVEWFDTAHPDGRIYAIPNGGTRSQAYTCHLHLEGMRKGAPDLIVAMPYGRVIWIEMKRAKKALSKLSDAQKDEHQTLMRLGHEVHVCYGADDAIEVIKTAYNTL